MTIVEVTTKKAPGKHYRNGISVFDLLRLIPDDDAAEDWFISNRWPNGPMCPHCPSKNIHERKGRKPQRFRCRSCKKYFSAKTGTVLQSSKVGYLAWVYAIYLLTTSLKGVSSMKLHRELSVTQRTAWFVAHRIRKAMEESDGDSPLLGAVEVDETYVGGKSRNMHARDRWKAKGNRNKAIVIGAKNRATKKVVARTIPNVGADSIGDFLCETVEEESTLYTDQNRSYAHHVAYHADYDHLSVNHSIGEYVNGMAHTNGIESFWSVLKRGYMGTYHRMSRKHLDRYVAEFAGRHNDRLSDTLAQMEAIARGMDGKRLRYEDLVDDDNAERRK